MSSRRGKAAGPGSRAGRSGRGVDPDASLQEGSGGGAGLLPDNGGTRAGPDGGTGAAGENGAALALWIQPRASTDAVVGERDGLVAIRLQAPPVDGAANAALIRFLARRLGCPATSVRLLRGERGRRKWISVEGLNAAELRCRLLALSGS